MHATGGRVGTRRRRVADVVGAGIVIVASLVVRRMRADVWVDAHGVVGVVVVGARGAAIADHVRIGEHVLAAFRCGVATVARAAAWIVAIGSRPFPLY